MNDNGTRTTQHGARIPRRTFLSLIVNSAWGAAGALLLAQVGRFLGYQRPAEAPQVITVGRPTDYPAGSLTFVAGARTWIGRDGGGLYALDAVCPHLGCLIGRQGDDGVVECPCHGSRFGSDGTLLHGPADRRLGHLALTLDGEGRLVVDRGRTVSPAARLADPKGFRNP